MFDPNDPKNQKDNFAEVPAGDYLAYVKKIEAKTSKSSGKPMVSVTLEIHEPGSEQLGRKLFEHFVYESNGAPYTRFCLAALPTCEAHDPTDQATLDDLFGFAPLHIKVVQKKEKSQSGVWENRARIAEFRALTQEEDDVLRQEYGDILVPGNDNGFEDGDPA